MRRDSTEDEEPIDDDLPYAFGARLLLLIAVAILLWLATVDAGSPDHYGPAAWVLIGWPAIGLALGSLAWDSAHRARYRARNQAGSPESERDVE